MTTTPTSLTDHLRQLIAQQGAISFSTFMQLALYHPEWGYYNRAAFQLGKAGDFITAPELTPLFAHCFATQCCEIFEHMPNASLLELGAGTGQLAVDLLTQLSKLGKLPERYLILEISPHLRAVQRAKLAERLPNYIDKVEWLTGWPTDFDGIIIGNEVLDALPVDCFAIHNGNAYERVVVTDGEDFKFDLREPITPGLAEAIAEIRQTVPMPENYASEVNLAMPSFITSMVNTLRRGVILLADYGYGQREYYHPERSRGTLTCFFNHEKSDNPFVHVGEQDITAHVDFTRVIECAHACGATFEGFTTQAGFLLANGLVELTSAFECEMDEIDKYNLHTTIKTLTLPTEMGDVIKVMGLSKGLDINLRGFGFVDRSRDLE